MSRELNQILTLAKDLNQQELAQLLAAIEELRTPDTAFGEVEVPEREKEVVRERFKKIDSGETSLNSWEDVKGRVFKK